MTIPQPDFKTPYKFTGPIKFIMDSYKNCCKYNDTILRAGTFIVVTDLPWYKSWFGLKKTRVKITDGIRTFKQLNFI